MYSIENYKDYTVYALNGISLRGFERNHLQIHLYASIQMYFYMLTLTTGLYIPSHPIYGDYNNYTFHSESIPKKRSIALHSQKHWRCRFISSFDVSRRGKNLTSRSLG